MKFTCKAYWRSLRKSFDLSKGPQADKHEQYEAISRRIHSFACLWLWGIGRKIAVTQVNSESKMRYHFIRWVRENTGKRKLRNMESGLNHQKTNTNFTISSPVWHLYISNNLRLTKWHLLQADAAESSPDRVKERHRPAVCAGLIPMPSTQIIITNNISITMWGHKKNNHY